MVAIYLGQRSKVYCTHPRPKPTTYNDTPNRATSWEQWNDLARPDIPPVKELLQKATVQVDKPTSESRITEYGEIYAVALFDVLGGL